jgi:hypothetical protein
MIFEVNLDAAKAVLRLKNGFKRLPFVAVRAINDTGKQVQVAVQASLPSRFTVRKAEFIKRQVKYFGASFSTTTGVGKWEARVGIGIGKPLGGSPLLLPRFETGGTRGGVKGGNVAMPAAARPSQPSSIPESLFIQRLALRKLTRGRPKKNAKPVKAGTVVRKGLLGTYQISGVGIFQRTAGAVARALYLFKPQVRLPATLQFYATAKRVIQTNFARNVQKYVNEAFARHG